MSKHRIEKVSAQLQREISQLITNEFSEKYGLITVADLHTSPDFKEAVVYVVVFDETKEQDILDLLAKNARKYQAVLGRKLKMKFTPRLSFKIDHSQEKINQVDKILREIEHGS